jgi:hypothetical protein
MVYPIRIMELPLRGGLLIHVVDDEDGRRVRLVFYRVERHFSGEYLSHVLTHPEAVTAGVNLVVEAIRKVLGVPNLGIELGPPIVECDSLNAAVAFDSRKRRSWHDRKVGGGVACF